ncbi:hypothetical protein BC941DRAFT_423034 [Chlamydoabsidia padenii]|nr:hypothetical protein BC941DRAFT_423034 [Chlamydoabsidia padenii]
MRFAKDGLLQSTTKGFIIHFNTIFGWSSLGMFLRCLMSHVFFPHLYLYQFLPQV